MKIFLSWSGPRSKAVAVALNELLPSILQPVTCWMSEEGIAKGKPWFDQLATGLNGILFGVFCVTPENKDSEWMQWEAGVLSAASTIGDRHVAPLAIGMSKGTLSGPFAIYQGTDVDRADMLRLVKDINGALADDKKVPVPSLEATFGYVWPDLERRIAAAVALPMRKPAVPIVSESDRFAEVIALLRDGQRETAETKAIIRRLEAVVEARATTRFVFSDPTNPVGGAGTLILGPSTIRGEGGTPLTLRAEQSPPVVKLTDPASGHGIVWGTSGSSD
jgi:TIR domain